MMKKTRTGGRKKIQFKRSENSARPNRLNSCGRPSTRWARSANRGNKSRTSFRLGCFLKAGNAKTVTHIMGLRAFSSQLLCEQVAGRGLRRTSYETRKTIDPFNGQETELFDPEYVNIFGVPFTFLASRRRRRWSSAASDAQDRYRAGSNEARV